MIKKVDFTRTGDCQLVLTFVNSLDKQICEEHKWLATDAINTLRLNSPHGVDPLGYVRIGLALADMCNEKE